MTVSARASVVRELAERIVVVAAPDELEMFPVLADAYVARQGKGVVPPGGRDESLGFGAGEVGALITPAALFVASAVVDEAAKELVIDPLKPLLARLFGRWRRKRPAQPGPGTPVPLTADQAAEVRRIAKEKAVAAKVPEATAELIADAVAAGLMLDSTRSRLYVRGLHAGQQTEAEVATEGEVGDDGADQRGQNGSA